MKDLPASVCGIRELLEVERLARLIADYRGTEFDVYAYGDTVASLPPELDESLRELELALVALDLARASEPAPFTHQPYIHEQPTRTNSQ